MNLAISFSWFELISITQHGQQIEVNMHAADTHCIVDDRKKLHWITVIQVHAIT